METIQTAFTTQGAEWMYAILFISVLTLAVFFERAYRLMKLNTSKAESVYDSVKKYVMSHDIDSAIKLCSSGTGGVLPQVLKSGLQRANRGPAEIENAVEESVVEWTPKVTARIDALAALGNIATLLGLLGTIIGLIDAFEALEKASPENRQRLLARGISLAMNTTAFGLIVAIPSLFAHMILSGIAKKILDNIDLYSLKLTNLLIQRGKPAA